MIAKEVRAELARQGITQDELARRLGTTQPWVSKRLTGKTAFDTTELDRIADALGVAVTQFLRTPERAA